MWQVVMWLLTYAFTASATSAHAFSFAAFPPEPPLNLPYRIDSRWWTSSTSIFFSMSVQLGLFLITGDILSMQLSSSWIKFNAKSKSDCEAIISNSRRCYMWRHWLLRKQQLNIQACLFQRKQKTTKWKYILFSLRPLATLQKSQDCFQISAHVSLISEMLVAHNFSKISPELEM